MANHSDLVIDFDHFPFSQVVVVGGSGMTGQRLVELFHPHDRIKILATSRSVSGQLPTGPLAVTMSETAGKWGKRVQWEPLDLEAESNVVDGQLQVMQRHIRLGEPLVLFLAAAFTNVEACETDPEKNQRINLVNTRRVLQWGKALGAHLVFFSTDYVFDGKAGPYGELEPRNALSQYGKVKAEIEEWIQNNAPQSGLIVRTTGVYDYI